jgi:uncharacterized protein YecE (DUF72 family)
MNKEFGKVIHCTYFPMEGKYSAWVGNKQISDFHDYQDEAFSEARKKVKEARKTYLENESNNAHAENYLLLAELLGNNNQVRLANENLSFQNRKGGTDPNLAKLTHDEVNPLYRILFGIRV